MVVAENPRDHFVFLDILEFYVQIQDNHFIPICLLVSTCVASCNICGCSNKKLLPPFYKICH
jgi:hypothetical protein